MQLRFLVPLALAALTVFACSAPERSPAGFRLPEGDVERGREAFVELKCNACHQVRGVDLPGPVADPPVPAVLGGAAASQPTDGKFVTSIINPSHDVGRYPEELVKSGDQSRMADYSDVMTVRQLVDIVAFLHAHTTYTPTRPMH